MTKLALLRHGESIWNKENRFTGWTDVDLSEKGIKDHVITNSEYEEIMRVANKDGIVDDHEQRLLSQLQGLLENGTLKRVKG